jgi:hypothetical protein
VNCKNCKNSSFLRNCVGCDNAQYCINSSNIVNDSYYIDNKKVTKELFEKYEGLTDETPNAIYETMSGSDNTGVFGAMNTSCKDSVGIYECTQVERSKYCWYVYNATDCYDFDVFGDGSQRVYESLAV